MSKIIVGYDDNLGLPNDFITTMDCNIQPYHDLGEMLQAFDTNDLAAIFIPSGTLPYVKNFQILAQALMGSENKKLMQSNFVSTENISTSDIPNLSIGRVNQ